MDVTISILAIMILVGLFVFVRSKEKSPKQHSRPEQPANLTATSQFHAVSIKFPSSACEAAHKMEGKRFLSSAAPRIPLPGCDAKKCKCRFVHHKDRREGEDRRSGYRQKLPGAKSSAADERRKRGDRRDDSPDDYFG